MTVDRKAGTKKPARPRKPRARKAAAPRPKWDVNHIATWGPERHELGASIPEAGNSAFYETGGWRTLLPVVDSEKCIGCMLCYFYCPDASVIVKNDKVVAFDLAHCKGCGICARSAQAPPSS